MKVRHIKETDADYQAIVASITPLNKIRKGLSCEKTAIYAEAESVDRRRHENVKSIRGAS